MAQGIYIILNNWNDLVRWYWHKYDLERGTHSNPHLQVAWRKYGAASFEFDLLEIIDAKLKMSSAWEARAERGDYYKFTAEQIKAAQILAAASLRQKWQDSTWRKNQQEKQSAGWREKALEATALV